MSFEQLGEPLEVAPMPSRGQLPRVLLALLGVGLLLGLVIGAGTWAVGTFARTEQGLCRVTWAPCTELSLASIESLSGLDLPDGTDVLDGYAQELGTLHEFRAHVVLPRDAAVSMSSAYEEVAELEETLDAAEGLAQMRYWTRPVPSADGHDLAATGTNTDGRTVIVFDERQVPQTP
jgi:hypothetical protein